MTLTDYIISMQRFMIQAIKEPYSYSFRIDNDNNKYRLKLI